MKGRVLGTVLSKLYVGGLSEFQGLKAFRVSGVVSEIYEKKPCPRLWGFAGLGF